MRGDRSPDRSTHAGIARRSTRTAVADRSTRAVSPVVGAILMFALALALLAVLQTTAIPAVNEQVEFQHSERVESDVRGVEATVDRVAARGTAERVRVEAGLRYPPRLLFVNPPPVAGTVGTGEAGTVSVSNARGSGETGDYWDGTDRRFDTRAVSYRPDYNEYGSAPITVAEPWIVYDRYENATLARTRQDLVDGRRVSLVAVDGTVEAAAAGTVTLDVRPTSAAVRTVSVGDAGDPIEVAVPTGLSESAWRDALDPQTCTDADGDDRCDGDSAQGHVIAESIGVTDGTLTFALERGQRYDLRLGRVALGEDAAEQTTAYITDVDGDGSGVPEGGQQRLVVEARDRFDNPVSGVAVDAAVEGPGTVHPLDDGVTDADGRAVFVYRAPADVDGSRGVTVTTTAGDGSERRSVAFDLGVTALGGGSDAVTGTPPDARIGDVSANARGNRDRYAVTVAASDPDGDLDRVEFELRDETLGDRLDAVTEPASGTDDSVTGRLATGDLRETYRIRVVAVDATGETGSDETTVAGGG